MGSHYPHIHHRPLGKPAKLETFSRNALVILNTAFVVFGFILFIYGIGGKSSASRQAYITITENGRDIFQVTSSVLIILGVILLLVGVWGLFGIHSFCKASIYVSLLLLLGLLDISLGVFASRIESNAKVTVQVNLINSLRDLKISQNPNDPNIIPIRNSWEALQHELKCCGVYGHKDWYFSSPIAQRRIELDEHVDESMLQSSAPENKLGNLVNSNDVPESEDIMRIPHSCFIDGNDGLEVEDFNTPISTDSIIENVYGDGCLGKAVADLDIDRLQRVGILMAVAKFLAVIFAISVTYHLRYNDKMRMMEENYI